MSPSSNTEVSDLRTMKRADLQKLAKKNGVKANMKNGDIIAALEEVLQSNFKSELESSKHVNVSLSTTDEEDAAKPVVKMQKKKQKRGRPTKKVVAEADDPPNLLSTTANSSPSENSFDLMSVKPPWDSSNDLIQLDSTPELDDSIGQGRRTRSSSRNRTLQLVLPSMEPVPTKTFSIDKTRTQSRLPATPISPTVQRQTAIKRRSTSAGDVIQIKRSRRDASADEAEDLLDEPIDEELRKEIMEELRKKREANGGMSVTKTSSSQIPRFTAKGVTVGTSKSVTPGNKNWNKIHHKRFEQLESIDDYERRKKRRAQMLLGSNQKNNAALSRLAKPAKRAGPSIVKPVTGKGRPKPTFMSPLIKKTARVGFQSPLTTGDNKSKSSSKISARQKTPKAVNTSVFKPTVTSTTKMNLNFVSRASKLVTPKRVTIAPDAAVENKSPKAKTLAAAANTTPGKNATLHKRKSVLTPFAVNSSVSTPGSARKNAFDLKASLKKPISWVPHKGPLKPFDDTGKKPTFQDRMNNLKKPGVAAKDKRRQKVAAGKKQAKDKRMLSRRGLK